MEDFKIKKREPFSDTKLLTSTPSAEISRVL